MSDTPDVASCLSSAERDGAWSPFFALSYHFGMLLGVDDFATEQAYHRGKMRLHNAWLHGAGVVWGFNVLADKERGEIRVTRGLALDGVGHELHLEGDACVNVKDWMDAQNKKDPALALAEDKPFDAHVEVRFKACATRQVPALLEPCDGAAGGGTAYSRIFETVDLRLVHGKAPEPATPTYPCLRVLFGLQKPGSDPAETAADAKRTEILKLPSEQQPAACLDALRHFAPADEIKLHPDSSDPKRESLFPAPDDAPIMLAHITGLTVKRVADHWELSAGNVDIAIRPVLVPTATIQELLCGPLFSSVAAPQAESGPRIQSVEIQDKLIILHVDKPLKKASVQPEAFSVTIFDDGTGWRDVGIDSIDVPDPRTTITLNLQAVLAADARVRLIAKGTGANPLMGDDYAPLAGPVGGPSPIPNDGIDYVLMEKRS